MLLEAQALEQRDRIGREDVASVLAGIDHKQNRDQATHDMCIAVAYERQQRPGLAIVLAIGLHRRRQPDLAGTALHLVGIVAVLLVKRRKRTAELDDVAVAVVPLVQQRKVLDDLVYGHGLAMRNGDRPHAPSIYSQA